MAAQLNWTAALDGLPDLSTVEKGKARVLLLRKSPEDAALLVSGLPNVAAEAIREILRQEGDAGAAAGLDVESAARAGAAAAGPGPASMAAGGAATGVAVAGSIGARLAAAVSPASVCNLRFTLFNGAQLATRFTAHAMALGIRGEVQHVSTSRSDFNMLTAADSDKLLTLVEFMHTLVPVLGAADAADVPSSSGIPYVQVQSDPAATLTSDRALVRLYNTKLLEVSGPPALQRLPEQAARTAEQDERSSKHSLGTGSSSSAHD